MSAFVWSEVTVPAVGNNIDQLRDFCSLEAAGGFIAVGDNGLVYTTTDAKTWNKITPPEANNWRGVAYIPAGHGVGSGSGRAIAVADNGTNRVMYSDDLGATWNTASASEANNWQSIAYAEALNLVVAVASTGTHRVMTSADGITWANQTAAAAKPWSGLCWSPDLGLLCAAAGGTGTQQLMTSSDASTWSLVTHPNFHVISGAPPCGSSIMVWSIVTGLLIVLGRDASTSDYATMVSSGGAIWVEENTLPDASTASMGGLCDAIAAGVDVLFRQAGTDRVNTTADAVTWTPIDPGYYRLWDCCGWNNTLQIAVSWDTNGTNTLLVGIFVSASFTSISPPAGPIAGGQTLTLTGSGFSTIIGTPSVTIGGTSATSVVVVNDTTITCLTPAHTHGLVSVVLVGVGTLSNAYTYIELVSVAPASGPGTGNQVVTLAGFGFLAIVGTPEVTFDGLNAESVVVVNDTTLTCVTPAHAGGLVDVSLVGYGTLASAYTYLAVTSVTPKKGTITGAQRVVITGFGFNGATDVQFGGTSVALFVITSNTTITAVTPAHHSGRVDVAVIGVATGANLYTYYIDTSVTSLPPVPTTANVTSGFAGTGAVTPSTSISAGTAALAGAVPPGAGGAGGGTGSNVQLMQLDYMKWLMAAKQVIENIPKLQWGSEQLVGVLDPDQIPEIPWSRVSKVGSVLSDIETLTANNERIDLVADPLSAQGVATKHYVDGKVKSGRAPVLFGDGGGDGEMGLLGPPGKQGAIGPAGPAKPGGPIGAPGADGNDGDSFFVPGIRGNTGADGASGKVVQVVNTETGAVATGTTTIPFDDSIPQNTEGTQFLTLAITPTNIASKLEIDVSVFATVTGTNWIILALFQDTTADALATTATFVGTSTAGASITLRHTMTAGTTSATTFKLRMGPNAAATVTFNGQSGGRLFGATAASSLTITEYTP